MTRFVPLDVELLGRIDAAEGPLPPEALQALCVPGLSTALMEGGQVLAAGGVVPGPWPGRAFCWIRHGGRMRPRHWAAAWCFCAGRLDRLVLDPAFRRIEATALCAQQPACRFLERLGFRFEAIMRAYGPDGRDHVLYARVSAASRPGDARRAPALAGGEAVYG